MGVTAEQLRASSRRHLLRYEPTVFQMRRVLARKARRIRAADGGDALEDQALIEAEIARLCALGALDDRRVTLAWLETYRRRGTSRRHRLFKMRERGVGADLVHELEAQLDDHDPEDADLRACTQYARRRRFGPFQQDPERRKDRREKSLAAMVRAGFSFALALRVLDASPEDLPDRE